MVEQCRIHLFSIKTSAESYSFFDTTIDWTPDLNDADEIGDTKGFIDEWNVSLRRGMSGLPTDYRPAARRIRTTLNRNGISVDREPPALRLSGDCIIVAFNWRAGEVGALCRRSGGGNDTVRNA